MHYHNFNRIDILFRPPQPKTATGQALTAVSISENTLTESLRLYLIATSFAEEDCLIAMQTIPVWCLKPSQKAALMGHICNELLGSSLVATKLEDCQVEMDNLRKEKWNLECQIRK